MATGGWLMTAEALRHSQGRPSWVLPLCWTAVLLDGFDLFVLGAVLHSLLDYGPWNLNPGTASLISVVGL